jgi:2-(1,2-epoxy-1,2-dihydrophenyl)acetyl-CoA isomerase
VAAEVEGADLRTIDTGDDGLLCRVEDRVAVVTLNRPEARNAITLEMKEALYRVVRALESDDGVGCLLLTGAGEAFCAGGDTKKMARDGKPPSMEDRQRQLRWEHRIPLMLHRWPKPVLAAVRGAAAGAGFSLSLCADIRIASDTAFFLTSFSRLGLSGDYGGTWFLTRLVGTAKARELYFTSDRVEADEALRIGLVNRVVRDAELDAEALALARRIAAGPPVAFRFMKANLNRALEADLATCLEVEADRMVRGAMTEDYQEAVRAFQEKRPPRFRGR